MRLMAHWRISVRPGVASWREQLRRQAVSVENLGAIAIGQFAARSLCVCSGVKMLLCYRKQVFWL